MPVFSSASYNNLLLFSLRVGEWIQTPVAIHVPASTSISLCFVQFGQQLLLILVLVVHHVHVNKSCLTFFRIFPAAARLLGHPIA